MQWKGSAWSLSAQVHVTFVAGGKVVASESLSAAELPLGCELPGGYGWLDDGTGLKLRRRRVAPPGVPACPECGFTWADFRREGRLGCACCWETFRDDLEREMKGLHRGARHAGKLPSIVAAEHART